jgi:hypothetical protein
MVLAGASRAARIPPILLGSLPVVYQHASRASPWFGERRDAPHLGMQVGLVKSVHTRTKIDPFWSRAENRLGG